MTVYTFQKPALHGDPSGITLCSDKLLRSPAPVFNTTGAPLPGSKLDRWDNGDWPQFTSTITPLYYRAGNGTVSTLTPVIGSSVVAVTGAKGGNAALASLIAALVQAGVPINDQTT
jgi:hypothetical protein